MLDDPNRVSDVDGNTIDEFTDNDALIVIGEMEEIGGPADTHDWAPKDMSAMGTLWMTIEATRDDRPDKEKETVVGRAGAIWENTTTPTMPLMLNVALMVRGSGASGTTVFGAQSTAVEFP